MEELESLLSSSEPVSTERLVMSEKLETVRLQVENHQRIRHLLESSLPTDSGETIRNGVVELYVEILFLDHSVGILRRKPSPDPANP